MPSLRSDEWQRQVCTPRRLGRLLFGELESRPSSTLIDDIWVDPMFSSVI